MNHYFIAPRDRHGRFVSVPSECPVCGDSLVLDDPEEPQWHCEGLVDPEDDSKPLQPCTYTWNPRYDID